MGQKILVVEDNELNLRLFCDILRAHDYESEPVRDGREALDRARAFVPDLIIMDIQMPYISGLEIIEQLKADVGLAPIPIMAVTAYAAKGDEDRIRDAGAEGYVSKPISVIRFVDAVRGLLDTSRQARSDPADAVNRAPPQHDGDAQGASIVAAYQADAATLVARFEALSPEAVLAPILDLLPTAPGDILDIGAGTGRDAAWLAAQGHRVVAAEPVAAFRAAGLSLHADADIRWEDDRLPGLRALRGRPERFDLILAVAVWQHLTPEDQAAAIPPMTELLAPDGRLILSIRHGPGSPTRPCFSADVDQVIADGEASGLRLIARREADSVQPANRDAGVTWTWLCLERRA